MIVTAILNLIVQIITMFLSPLPTVTELPFDMDFAAVFFVSTVKGLVNLLPWFGIVWTLLLWALYIKFILYAWHWARWLIELVRG